MPVLDTPYTLDTQAASDTRHAPVTLCIDGGDIVLWQVGGTDSVAIVVAPEHVEALATALLDLVRDLNPPTAQTNAERQRRYRERQRNAAVTPTD